MTDDMQKRIEQVMLEQGLDEQGARFVIALADGELTGDIDGDAPLDEKPTLGDVVRGEREE